MSHAWQRTIRPSNLLPFLVASVEHEQVPVSAVDLTIIVLATKHDQLLRRKGVNYERAMDARRWRRHRVSFDRVSFFVLSLELG